MVICTANRSHFLTVDGDSRLMRGQITTLNYNLYISIRDALIHSFNVKLTAVGVEPEKCRRNFDFRRYECLENKLHVPSWISFCQKISGLEDAPIRLPTLEFILLPGVEPAIKNKLVLPVSLVSAKFAP